MIKLVNNFQTKRNKSNTVSLDCSASISSRNTCINPLHAYGIACSKSILFLHRRMNRDTSKSHQTVFSLIELLAYLVKIKEILQTELLD